MSIFFSSVMGEDFAESGPGVFQFSFGVGAVTPACVNIAIIDDDDLEGDHTFSLSLGGTNTPSLGGGTGGFGAQTTTAVTIQDPEGTLLNYEYRYFVHHYHCARSVHEHGF